MEFRGYESSEFEFACNLRGLVSQEQKHEYRQRFDASGDWDGHYLDYVIDVQGIAIGEVQLRHCPKTMPPKVLEFGIEISPKFHSLGYGTQATISITELMFAQGFHRISGSTSTDNIAMRRVFEKSGWIHEGVLHALFLNNGRPVDYASYSKTKFQTN